MRLRDATDLGKWHVATDWRPERLSRVFHLMATDSTTRRRFLLTTASMEEAGFGSGYAGDPPLEMPEDSAREFLQAWMDAAWSIGLRPSGVKDLEGTLEATKRHLDDMRDFAKTSFQAAIHPPFVMRAEDQ